MNSPTTYANAATVGAREAECPLADFIGGVNLAASNACGIGIATDVEDPKLQDWSVLDQFGVARVPQNSQHIGGNGYGAGDDSATFIGVWDNETEALTGQAQFTDSGVRQWSSDGVAPAPFSPPEPEPDPEPDPEE